MQSTTDVINPRIPSGSYAAVQSYSLCKNTNSTRKILLNQWRQLHGARGRPSAPTFTNCWSWGGAQQETDQTVLTITKTLTKTTNCILVEPKKWRGSSKNFFWHFTLDERRPTFKFIPATPYRTKVCDQFSN